MLIGKGTIIKVWSCWSRCDLVGRYVSLGVGSEVSEAEARLRGVFLMPVNLDVEFLATSLKTMSSSVPLCFPP